MLLIDLYNNFSTFCLVDAKANCMVVTLYNLADGKGVIIGDSIAIPEPFVTHQKFNYDDKVQLLKNCCFNFF